MDFQTACPRITIHVLSAKRTFSLAKLSDNALTKKKINVKTVGNNEGDEAKIIGSENT